MSQLTRSDFQPHMSQCLRTILVSFSVSSIQFFALLESSRISCVVAMKMGNPSRSDLDINIFCSELAFMNRKDGLAYSKGSPVVEARSQAYPMLTTADWFRTLEPQFEATITS